MSFKLKENGYGNMTVLKTSTVRISFPHILEKDEKYHRYSCELLIPKEDKEQVEAIKTALKNAKEDGKTRLWGGKIPNKLGSPIRDGDDDEYADYDGYSGCYVLRANTQNRPKVYDKGPVDELRELENPEDMYGGCYVQANVEFAPYNNQMNGIRCTLYTVKKVRDGEKFGGGGVPDSAVDFDDDGDDEENDDLGL